jgi:hypothetical protein
MKNIPNCPYLRAIRVGGQCQCGGLVPVGYLDAGTRSDQVSV